MMRRGLVAALFLLVASIVYAVGTVTFTSTNVGSGFVKYQIDWVSDASGDVNTNAVIFDIVKGALRQAQFTPDSGGTQPTDLYDATFTFNGVDVLDGVAANLSDTTSKIIMFDPPIFYDATSNFDLVITNAGNAKGGTFLLWVSAP